MLQPNQPMGQPNMAAATPQLQKPQGVPAGALMGMMPQGGIMAPIDKVAGAYQGNPQALEQKAIGGDLLAALALQRLKTEKEAAMRQMQMAAAGQQGGPQPTVVDQLEQQALDLTKQEMQAEQMDTLKQKQGQMQEGQKRLMQQAMNPQAQGIGGLPAPNAAEPRAMAAGGIVAFAGGGDEGLEFDPNAYTPDPSKNISDYLPTLTKLTPEQESEMNRLLREYKGRVSARQAREIAQGKAKESDIAPTEIVQPTPATPAAAPKTNAANIQPPAGIAGAVALPGGAQQPIPKPAPAANAGIAAGAKDPLTAALSTNLAIDPAAKSAEERKASYEFMQHSPEDIAARREGLASLKAIGAAESDPDRQWVRRMLRTLPSSGTSFMANTLGQVGANAMAARDEEYARQRQNVENEQNLLKGIMSDVYTPKKEAVAAGTQAGAQAAGLLGHTLSSATHKYIGELQAQAQRDAAAAMREGQSDQRLMVLQSNNEKARQAAMAKIASDPKFQALGMLGMMPEKDRSKAQQAQFTALNSELQAAQMKAAEVFDGINAQIMAKLNRSGSGIGQGTVDFSKLPK